MNCLLLDTLHQRTTSAVPVWLMRQAGRYMQEYRALKESHGFLGLCRNPELACEVTLQPIKAFGPDAAILFADIMLPAECLGFDIDFAPGPIVKNAIRTPEDIEALPDIPMLEKVSYVPEAIERIQEALQGYHTDRGRIGLFGFAATPWTLACYLIDQTPYKHFAGTQIFAAKYPEAFSTLLAKLSTLTASYLQAQIDAGADAVQLFDSWGGILTLSDYRRLSAPAIRTVISALSDTTPVVLYTNGSAHLLEELATIPVAALSIDARTSLRTTAELAPTKCIQGNLDPSHLFLSHSQRAASIKDMLESAPTGRYIANLGHGVLQKTPVEAVAQFVETIQSVQL